MLANAGPLVELEADKTIWLLSWPRCGNTLLRTVLWHCFGLRSLSAYDEKSTLLNNEAIADAVGARSNALPILPQTWHPVKTHAPLECIQPYWDAAPRGIYILRDGREACVSLWRWQTKLRLKSGSPPLPLSHYIKKRIPRGDVDATWSEHLRSWKPREREGLLFVRFEYLAHHDKAVRMAQLTAIEGLLGMERIADEWPGVDEMRKLDPAFFHSGLRETWMDEMTGNDLELFYTLHGDAMREYGYL